MADLWGGRFTKATEEKVYAFNASIRFDKRLYGIRGEKAGRTAGSGIGGHIVKSFVENYNGDYDLFMDNIPYDEWCAYLKELLVKYKLYCKL